MLRAALHWLQPKLPAWQHKILRALAACRTPALGGHRYRCSHCGREHFVPHACRNRHCPDCQPAAAADWLEAQAACLLPIPYFHLVFTLPHDLNALIQQNQRLPLNRLFATVSATLLEFGHHRFGAQLGLTLILHTWGQTLIDHDRFKTMTLSWQEFLRRFCLHLLPERFVKIRHYGLLSNRLRHRAVEQARQLLAVAATAADRLPTPMPEPAPREPAPLRCPYCGHLTLQLLEIVAPTLVVCFDDTS